MHAQLISLLNELQATKGLRPSESTVCQGADPRFSAEELKARFDAYTVMLKEDSPRLGIRCDADENVFLARQLLFIQAKEVQQQFTILKATKFIPVDGSIPTGAESFSTPIYSQTGKAEIVTNYGNGFPTAEVALKEKIVPCRSIGTSYHYTVQDLRRASMAGQQPLDQRRATVARMVHDRKVESVAAFGDALYGLPGMLTGDSVGVNKFKDGDATATDTLTGAWESASSADIYKDLQTMAAQIPSQSHGTFEGDTLVLPISAYEIAAKTPYSTLNPESILGAFLRSNVHIKNVDSWAACDNFDTDSQGGTSAPITTALNSGSAATTRAVVYMRNPMVLDLKIPQQFEQFAPQLMNLQFNIPCHSRIGGTVIYYPLAMAYFDGLVDRPSN